MAFYFGRSGGGGRLVAWGYPPFSSLLNPDLYLQLAFNYFKSMKINVWVNDILQIVIALV